MLKLFEEGRTDPVYYVARPYGGITILVMVSPIMVDGELVGYSQVILLKDEIQELFRRFDESGFGEFLRRRCCLLVHSAVTTDR